MKKLILVFLLFFAGFAFADLTVVQKVQTAGMMGQPPKELTITIYIKGPRARIEGLRPANGESVYQIIDLTQKKMWIVNDAKKQVTVLPPEMMDAAQHMMEQSGKQAKTDVQKTGKKDKVNGYKCEEYTINTTGGIMDLNSTECVTNDVRADEFEPFRKYAESFAKMMGSEKAPKGFAVRTQAKISMMGQTFESKSEVQSISHVPIATKMFEIPSDYKVRQMPQSSKAPHQ